MQPSERLNTRIGQIVDGTPAAQSLVIGEKITAIDDKTVDTWEDINYALAGRMGETADLSITTEQGGKIFQKPYPSRHSCKASKKAKMRF